MDRLEPEALRELIRHPRGGCVSIYFATPCAGTALRENPIWLKNAAGQAESRLERHGLRSTLARQVVAPIRKLEEETEFWKHLGHGIALFAAEDLCRAWRLPTAFAPSVRVGPRFHLLPLLAEAQQDDDFYVLSVHRNGVHLYRGDRHRLTPVDDAGLPPAAKEALHLDERQSTVQAHTGNPRLPGNEGRVFHGQGAAPDVAKDELGLYFRQVDRAVCSALGPSRAPLVYAGLPWQFHIYREVNRCPALADRPIADSPSPVDLATLHREACEVLAARWAAPLSKAQAQLHAGLGKGLATADAWEALRAAQSGAVESLLVAQDAELPGRYDAQTQSAEPCNPDRPEAEDLLNVAAILTVEQGGRVFQVPRSLLPDGGLAAAVYRYEVVLPPVGAAR